MICFMYKIWMPAELMIESQTMFCIFNTCAAEKRTTLEVDDGNFTMFGHNLTDKIGHGSECWHRCCSVLYSFHILFRSTNFENTIALTQDLVHRPAYMPNTQL